ncbi:DUF4199 domain-containing protein [Hymenobacter setariae]|uniref:DUF4199 domain-containing protein n=1 Tax=Hymenobacter setariae TaxID=2594794 RepID=A0A558BNY8_9BACT|nr:DUF4199 domain-containing protein [Hymenobacter setariae]TVT38222.1 DUF4199 domain-containing protein [Hymenobacter setariae]
MLPSNEPARSSVAAVRSGAVGRLGLRFGLAAGLVCGLWLLFLHFTGNEPFSPKQIMGLLVVPFAAAASQWLLRREAAPGRPGVGRSLAVGGLTVLLAALLAAGSTWGLATALGDKALAYSRAELVEITRVQQKIRPKEKRNAEFERKELEQAAALSKADLARGTFTWTVLLGMMGAIPAGIFLRK